MAAVFEIQPAFESRPAREPRSVQGTVRSSEGPQRVQRSSAARRVLGAAVLLAVVALAALMALVASPVGLAGSAASRGTVEASGEYHVVSEGDTLYSVAQEWAPASPVADTIEQISTLNGGLDEVSPGQVVSLPQRP